MPYELKPLACDAAQHPNAFEQRLAELSRTPAPVFETHGPRREEMIASGSMILHELYFDSLGDAGGEVVNP